MNEEHCIVCLDEYKGTKEEHLKICRRFPIFATTDVPVDASISRLYLMDMDSIEIPYCDCILYDRNGNPNCGLHQGRLQEFFDMVDVGFISFRKVGVAMKYHLLNKDGEPYCKHRLHKEQIIVKTKGYVTCKNCLKRERIDREREVEAYQILDKLDDEKKGFYYEAEKFKTQGRIRDLQ